jgi:response regulator RpfG family c-di-GMP phosphodiesterase
MSKLKPTILIVDDEPTNIEILSETLRTEYEILVATNGAEALHVASHQMPDLILLDVIMPELDGYEVCVQLKTNPRTKSIPVIFITAMSEETNEEKGLNAGAIDYITKPISPAIVRARVHNHLELKLAAQEREKLILELQSAMAEIKTLNGLLPICANCKKIRDDAGYWTHVESYIQERSGARFSHGICPECVSKLYPELFDPSKNNTE